MLDPLPGLIPLCIKPSPIAPDPLLHVMVSLLDLLLGLFLLKSLLVLPLGQWLSLKGVPNVVDGVLGDLVGLDGDGGRQLVAGGVEDVQDGADV